MMQKVVLLLLLCPAFLSAISPVWADPITAHFSGTFEETPVVHYNPDDGFGPFLSPGTIIELPEGYRYLLVENVGWKLMPIGKEWVTQEVSFTGSFMNTADWL